MTTLLNILYFGSEIYPALCNSNTKGLISRNYLCTQFVHYHGKAGRTSRMLGTYSDSVITIAQLIKAVQAAWPEELKDGVIQKLISIRCKDDELQGLINI